jgi:hypothetical protein
VARFFLDDTGAIAVDAPAQAALPAPTGGGIAPASSGAIVAAGAGVPEASAPAEVRGTNRLDRISYALNAALFDWSAVLPIQESLEPRSPNVRRLQRFLRTARTPFLVLLMAPAMLPMFFTQVPGAGRSTARPWGSPRWSGRDARASPTITSGRSTG